MRRYAVLTLSVSAIFLMAVGVLANSKTLFIMCTLMMMTLVAMRLQAMLATRGLKFERIAPTVMVAGELVSIRLRVWSLIRLRRPLLIITDVLPPKLASETDLRPLPVAPNFEEAVETRYEIRPLKRGIFRWSRVRVTSTDSLGLIMVTREYETEPFEVVIHPAKIPFGADMLALSGWGANQSDEGRNRGVGIEPRGVREFMPGDSLRQVHWKSTARTGVLQVKEFDTGFNTNLLMMVQQTDGTEAGDGALTTLEAMCGHAAFLADVMLNRGSTVSLPNLESPQVTPANSSAVRFRQVCDALSAANADRHHSFASEFDSVLQKLRGGSTLVLFLSAAEPGLSDAIRRAANHAQVVCLVYDAPSYAGTPLAKGRIPATDPDFLAAISMPGVTIKMMANPFHSDEKAA
ncbi:MAG: hypothetical protein AKCLJLPJ_00069 [Fimbriimonadales bacterium]|nr:MAG: DUF58 domain-containing protein [Armatimonadota bacterium]MBV6502026.1 hypothetical protein [Fimbriimonadales bacterium]MCE7898861.1 DUF58 domain-containing protein [Armatimonadetes bacterium ATM1]MDL1928925.1 DUF58 domain-containing protein [Fimbriimonadia bacterium ATM]MBC6969592.1 DUF58 domain-containing protein [Armatimonadota bacterium]